MTAASPFARLHRLAERAEVGPVNISNGDTLSDLTQLLAYAEAAHAWASYHTQSGTQLTGAYEAWVAFKAADRALGGE